MPSLNGALLTGVAVGLISAIALIIVAWFNNNYQLRLENKKMEAGRILEVIKIDDPYQVRRNLYWLFETKLVTDEELVNPIKQWYSTHDPKEGPAFPQHIRPEGVPSQSVVSTPSATTGPPPATEPK